MVWGIVVGAIVVVFLLYFVLAYNGFVVMKNSMNQAMSNIDVMLKQRYDEIGKLVDTVKGYVKHEKKTFENIAKLRSQFSKAKDINERLAVDAQLDRHVMNLFAVAENYPTLKANENFMQLQGRITSLENEIADRREGYNSTVFEYNNKVQRIPSALVARLMGLQTRNMFKASEGEKKDVKISF
jgi:LemA protein